MGQPCSIVQGRGIGNIAAGNTIDEVVGAVGTPKATLTRGGLTMYAWYEFVESQPGNVEGGNRHALEGGLVAYADRAGKVTRVGIYYDSRYATLEGLHTRDRRYASEGGRNGSTETEIRVALGAPTSVSVRRGPNGEPEAHALVYPTRGITFWLGDNRKMNGYNEVY